MLRSMLLAVTLAVGLPLTANAAPDPQLVPFLTNDIKGAGDHPLVGRYTGSVLLARTHKAFDELKLPSGPAQGSIHANDKKFVAIVKPQGVVTRMIYLAPAGRSSPEVTTNFTDSVAAKGFEPVYSCAGAACGESFVILKYRWDRPETKVVGPNYEQLRRLLIDASFDSLLDVRYTLFRKSAPEGDTFVAVYGGTHSGGAFGAYSEALQDRVGVLVEIVEPRARRTAP